MTQNPPRHARIIATVGPSSKDKETLKKLVAAGVDIFRLNFSHGTHDDHSMVYANIRAIEDELGKPITVMQDLQGPKIRIGEMAEPVKLKEGATFNLDGIDKPGTQSRVHLPHPDVLEAIRIGDLVYLNDGLVRLRVRDKEKNRLVTEVIAGGPLSSHKGVNLPGVELPFSALTKKDIEDLKFGLQLGVDVVALSFVQRPEDVMDLRKRVGDKAMILVKIEKPSAVERIDDIIDATDAVMVARGDLGVEMPLEEVPSIQKRLIRKCREKGKPVVVATQMLESMIHNASPTRAEVSDVANATYEGADALMLSAETAAGKYPIEAVETMARVIKRVEQSSAWRPLIEARGMPAEGTVSDAITSSAANFAETIEVKAIVTFTESGSTARRMARQRPSQPILVLTPHHEVARRLKMIWGTIPVVERKPNDVDDLVTIANEAIKSAGLVQSGDRIIITAGIPFGVKGSTNMIRVESIS